jgi:aryl-alcohol dehydrogenase-like predicted oxidoreductase
MSKRLCIGTAQFGLPYGITNPTGTIAEDKITAILKTAWQAGSDTLDTAISYGGSERVLGVQSMNDWKVITKIPPVPEGIADVNEWVRNKFQASLDRLGVRSLYGLLVHQASQLEGPEGANIYRAIQNLKEDGLVRKIGVSVYNPECIGPLIANYPLDLVQAPLNILDRRLLSDQTMGQLKAKGVEVHARSIFLQGILLQPFDTLPPKFSRWRGLWKNMQNWMTQEGISAVQACVGFVFANKEIDRVIVGVTSENELAEVIRATKDRFVEPPPELVCNDADLINPSKWN